MTPFRLTLLGLAAVALASPLCSAAASRENSALTVYSSARPGDLPLNDRSLAGRRNLPGFATVTMERSFHLQAGDNRVTYSDIPELIDPGTVRVQSLTDPDGTQLIDQSYRFDTADVEGLLQHYLNRRITVTTTAGSQTRTYDGTLLSTEGGLVLLQDDGSVRVLRDYAGVLLPQLPDGTSSKPALNWRIHAGRSGDQQLRISYRTRGMTWWADYDVLYTPGADAAAGTVAITPWVTVVNRSGADYRDASLQLVAGDVQQGGRTPRPVALEARQAAATFVEQPFSEYHLYSLDETVNLPDQSSRQLTLFTPVRGVAATRELLYEPTAGVGLFAGGALTQRDVGLPERTGVDVYLHIANTADNGLGMPLPAGNVRVSQTPAADSAAIFIGEDEIDHTPRGETLQLSVGRAFDLVGQRRQTDYQIDTRARWAEEAFALTLRNHRDTDEQVTVREALYRGPQWRILSSSDEFEREDARHIRFRIQVPANGEHTVTYRVRYEW